MFPFPKEGRRKLELVNEEFVEILDPLYQICPLTRMFNIKEDKIEKKELIAIVISALCSAVCKLTAKEEILYSPRFYTYIQKQGIMKGVCDDVMSWIECGDCVTKQEAQILVKNTCEYLSK